MQLLLLGPVEVVAAGRSIPIGHPKQRAVLAALAADANRVVPTERLTARVWSYDPPKSARNLLSGYIAGLRAALAGAAGDGGSAGPAGPAVRVDRGTGGYQLLAEPEQIDLSRFRRLVERSRAIPAPTDPAAGALLDEALALWRGAAIADIGGDWADSLRRELDEERLAAMLRRNDLALRQGRHAEVLNEVRALVDAYPADERARAQLMLALYRAGRPADALAAYAAARRWLADELGLDPGAELRLLERQMLRNDPALAPPPIPPASRPAELPAGQPSPPSPRRPSDVDERPAPRQLPGAPVGFAGRADALAALDRLLAEAAGGDPPTGLVVAISGTAGVGKTALALEWARRVRDQFPDGDLYAHLRGHTERGPARSAADVLPFFLRALGVPAEAIPDDVDDMAAAYRTALADRRVLVVLDDAIGPAQIRPLLPGTVGSAVLVTSRVRLTGMAARDGIRLYPLDVLAPADAVDLFGRLLGPQRTVPQRGDVAQLADACARLPLALRIAAAQLACDPALSVASYVDELAQFGALDTLRIDGDPEAAVQGAFELSYRRLEAAAQELFGLLALLPGPHLVAPVAAALAGVPVAEAARRLAVLRDVHLLEPAGPGQLGMHDLLRQYAVDLLTARPAADREAGWQRLLDWYLAGAVRAAKLLSTGPMLPSPAGAPAVPPLPFDDAAGARRWLDTHRADLVAAGVRAATDGPVEYGWLLLDAVRVDLRTGRHLSEWMRLSAAALTAAEAATDHSGQIVAELESANAAFCVGQHPRAIEHYRRAIEHSRASGWQRAEATAHGNLGMVLWTVGQLADAVEAYEQGRALDRLLGNRRGEVASVANLGIVSWELGRLETALAYYQEALRLAADAGSAAHEAMALLNVGLAHRDLGRYDEGVAALDRALPVLRAAGDHAAVSFALDTLAGIEREQGRLTEAVDHAREALALAEQAGDQRSEVDARNTVGSVRRLLGAPDRAGAEHRAALLAARAIDYRRGEVEALLGLAAVAAATALPDDAGRYADEALVIADRIGFAVLAGEALSLLADAERRRGHPARADDYARRAAESRRQTGHRPGPTRGEPADRSTVERGLRRP